MEVINIDYEVVVKYNGDILKLENELGVDVEILSPTYAIIIADNPNKFDELLNYSEIEYVEKPFVLVTQDEQSFSSTGITSFKNRTGLTGNGTILGLIDSGIDYTLPIFKDASGKSKILYLWDQSIKGTPPEGFKSGSLYTNEDINQAINGEKYIPISITATHGTHVSGIAASIANDADIIFVRVGNRQTDYYSKSTEFMRAIKFILDKSLELKRPVAINISYGSNEGSHRGLSLFEQYIDDQCLFWKNNIVVAAGNNANKGGHKRIQLTENSDQDVEVVIGENEMIININIWPNFIDEFSIIVTNPSNQSSQALSLDNPNINNTLGNTRVTGVFYPIEPYSLARRVTIRLTSTSIEQGMNSGIWRLKFRPIKIVNGQIDLYLPTSEGISANTRFLSPSNILTVTVPGTATRVITVGSFDSRTDTVSIFSGRGDVSLGVYKPDILAPGENILSFLPGGTTGALTGTSMATPHVTGVCALLMEWGIVKRNDLYLYSQRSKALLLDNARRLEGQSYPSNESGFGFLYMRNIILRSYGGNEIDGLFRTSKNTDGANAREEDTTESAFLTIREGFLDELKSIGLENKFTRLSENTGILNAVKGYEDALSKLVESEVTVRATSVISMELLGKPTPGVSGGINANEEIGVNFIKNNPNMDITGRGVLICVADSGIDYLHEDFIYEDGTSKIAYIWDQTKEGNPPKGFYIGTEYTKEDINKAIAAKDDSLTKDETGSGTLISGICAGLGRVKKEYEGVAPQSELVIVKLKTVEGFTNNAYFYIARQYALFKSQELKKPIIMTDSVGNILQAGYISGIVENELNLLKGYCEVGAVGNEANTQTHTTGRINRAGESKDVEFEVTKTEPILQVYVWVDRPDQINVKLISPSGEESKDISVGYYITVDGQFDFENTKYFISYIYPTIFSGQQLVQIIFHNITRGTWKIRLTGLFIISGKYNIYMNNKAFLNEGTNFSNPDPFYTVNFPAIQDYLISVGAYDLQNNNIWPPSSRGPNIQNDLNPNIIAPGVNIIGPYPNNTYGRLTGTAASAAYVSGACALFYQHTIVDNKYPKQGFIPNIKAFLQLGARRNEGTVYPNDIAGYGLLNVRGTFEQFR
ncbi:bifunctional germination protease/germinant receptor pseudoprotease CspBA [Terrisporobacter mayombei]|uniref:Peptidase S8 n=1 Tax=Terrisporobacter mayombei TaxID=1541 RepID=A0ABY9PXP0_9FIRM|nr:bifunctional germination protease/germinant receptor pseudoprotease CspBA [Terrisporobacter mayombei]WMT79860.1 hypothetical protein TEMA_01300 [Terrisporobacter mayombei]